MSGEFLSFRLIGLDLLASVLIHTSEKAFLIKTYPTTDIHSMLQMLVIKFENQQANFCY